MLDFHKVSGELIAVFAEHGKSSVDAQLANNDVAIDLLRFLHRLAQSEQLPLPSLDRYLAGKHPVINLSMHARNHLHFIRDLQADNAFLLSKYSQGEYEQLCRDQFPRVVLDACPIPADNIGAYKNFFVTWFFELSDMLGEDTYHASADFRLVFRIIREYIDFRIYAWPDEHLPSLFKRWNQFLRPCQWPEQAAELELVLERQKKQIRLLENTLAEQAQRLKTMELAAEEPYISLSAAARVLLTALHGKPAANPDINTFAKRISRKCRGFEVISVTKTNYFRLRDVEPLFQAEEDLKMTASQISIILLKVSVPKSSLNRDIIMTK